MQPVQVSDQILKLAVSYFAESAISLLLFFILLNYALIYKREFLRIWSYSWLAFFFSSIVLGSLTLYGVGQITFIRHFGSYLSIVAHMSQVLFLLMGSYELIQKKKYASRVTVYYSLAILIIGFLVVIFYSSGSESAGARYLIRLGFRFVTLIVGYTWAAYIVARSSGFSKGLGKNMIAVSFLLYGSYHVYYLSIVIANTLGANLGTPFFFGMVEVVLVFMMGLSMIIWLLEDERSRLLKANKELDEFLYSTYHDLRSPIASVLGITNLAKLERLDAVSLHYMNLIEDRLHKLDIVISDISNVMRSKRKDLKFRQFDFNILISEIISEVKFLQGTSNVEFRYPQGAPNFLYTDYDLLKTVIVNIVVNAIKFQDREEKRPYVQISFSHEVGRIQIEIEDNGQGIPESSLNQIFDMFYRANITSDGTGLGLYIASEAIAKINGTISVNSTVGVGSSFKIAFEKA